MCCDHQIPVVQLTVEREFPEDALCPALCAPEGAVPGERITWSGTENIQPHGVNKVAKKKIWEGVQKDLKTDAEKGANWNGMPMLTSAGQCSCASLTNANVG